MNSSLTRHATCVAYDASGLLILGNSGSGKSGLALQLLALGATLVADDQVTLKTRDCILTAHCPPAIKGMIEARGVGLLAAQTRDSAIITVVVDLDQPEPDRLPPNRKITILGVEVDLVFGKDTPNLPVALHQMMQIGRLA